MSLVKMPGADGLSGLGVCMKRNVVSATVKDGLCVGCGICAGVCPHQILKMDWRKNGDISPRLQGKCPSNCDICLKVCPFGPYSHNTDQIAQNLVGSVPGILHKSEVGHYLASYAGYSCVDDHRANGASGGMATWLLERLLETNTVDKVICVGKGDARELFSFKVMDNAEQVRAASGSRYYPVNISNVLSAIMNSKDTHRYAIIALPCMVKGLRLSLDLFPRLRRQVAFIFGLTCGHLPNRYYTEFLSRLSGIMPNNLETADYRRKDGTQRAGNYRFRAQARDGRWGRDIAFSGRISMAWGCGFFQFNSCNFCDDVFAELADVCFMDAWLPEYERDPCGHSMLLVRNPQINALFQNGIADKSCCLEPVSIDKILKSQAALIYSKKVKISGRLYAAEAMGQKIPPKSISPSNKVYMQNRSDIDAKFILQHKTKRLWPRYRSLPIWRFYLRLIRQLIPLTIRSYGCRLKRVAGNPLLVLRFFAGIVLSKSHQPRYK